MNYDKGIKIAGVILILLIVGIVIYNTVPNNNNDNNTFNDGLYNTKKAAFKSDAIIFIDVGRNILNKEQQNELLNKTKSKYVPSCNSNNNNVKIYLDTILSQLDGGGKTSPFGSPYNSNSYVMITAKQANNSDYCSYEYSIYLSDNNYSIGSINSPVLSTELNNNIIQKNK